jgi:hypothetical protein
MLLLCFNIKSLGLDKEQSDVTYFIQFTCLHRDWIRNFKLKNRGFSSRGKIWLTIYLRRNSINHFFMFLSWNFSTPEWFESHFPCSTNNKRVSADSNVIFSTIPNRTFACWPSWKLQKTSKTVKRSDAVFLPLQLLKKLNIFGCKLMLLVNVAACCTTHDWHELKQNQWNR